MTSPDNLRDKLIFYIGQESVAPGIRADKILDLFNSKLDKIVSEIEEAYNPSETDIYLKGRSLKPNDVIYLDTAISIIQNNKETE